MATAATGATTLPAELITMSVMDTSTLNTSVQLIEQGPQTNDQRYFPADTYTDNNVLFQSVIPPSSTIVMDRELLLQYELLVGYSVQGTSTDFPNGYPFIPGAHPWDYRTLGVFTGDTAWPNMISTRGGSYSECIFKIRSCPLNSAARSIQVDINGQTRTIPSSELTDMYPFFKQPAANSRYLSSFPFYRDTGSVLENGSDTITQGTTQSDVRAYEGELPSKYAVDVSVVGFSTNKTAGASTGFSIVYKLRIREPLMIQPFLFGETYKKTGLTRVMSMMINITLGDLHRMLKVHPATQISAGMPAAAGNAIFNYQVSLGAAGMTIPSFTPAAAGATAVAALVVPAAAVPQLGLHFIQPSSTFLKKQPQTVIYPADLIQTWSTDAPTVVSALANPVTVTSLATATWTATSQALRLPSIPQVLHITVKPSAQARDTFTARAGNAAINGYNLSDTFMHVTRLEVQFMDRSGLLIGFDALALYRMAVKNGYQGDYYRWRYLSGSLLVINTTEDLCLGLAEAPGQNVYSQVLFNLQGNYDVQVNSAFTASTDDANPVPTLVVAQSYRVQVTAVIPGKVAVGQGTAVYMTEGPAPQQMFALVEGSGATGSGATHTKESVEGGSFGTQNSESENPVTGFNYVQRPTQGSLGPARVGADVSRHVLENIMDQLQQNPSSVNVGNPSSSNPYGGDIMGGDIMGGDVIHHKRSRP